MLKKIGDILWIMLADLYPKIGWKVFAASMIMFVIIPMVLTLLALWIVTWIATLIGIPAEMIVAVGIGLGVLITWAVSAANRSKLNVKNDQ